MTDFFQSLNALIFHPLTLGFAAAMTLTLFVVFGLAQVKTGKPRPIRFSETGWLNILGWFAVLFAPVLVILFLSVLAMLAQVGTRILTGDTMQGEADNLRWYVLAFVGLLTSLGGIIGTPLALIRVWTTERQTKTAEQSHIAEVLAKAGENLGAEKTVKRVNADGEAIEKSVPALEVRSLGLLALERLARETPDYHIQVMEIISAYIRHNAESYAAHKQNFGGDQRHRLRDDLETALRILMRRKVGQISREKASDFKVSLANTSFMGLTLVELGFPNVDLKNTNLSHAELTSIDFRDTWLSMTDFSNSKISDVQFPTFWSPFGSFHEAVLTRCTLPLHIFWLHGLSCDKARFLSCEFSHTSPEPHKVISGASSPSSALFVDCKFPPNFLE